MFASLVSCLCDVSVKSKAHAAKPMFSVGYCLSTSRRVKLKLEQHITWMSYSIYDADN